MARINISDNPNAQGTDSNDVITDTDNGRRTFGLGGNDFINGFGGNDELFGNLGRDTLRGGTGSDTLYGGQDGDELSGGLDNDLIFGNLGTDDLTGDRGDDRMFGGRDNDRISGGDGDDFLSGDGGFDILRGGPGRDTFVVQNELATNSFDHLFDFVLGEDKIALGGGLSFNDLQISTIPREVANNRANNDLLDRQFAPWSGAIAMNNDRDLLITLRSTGRTIARVDNQQTGQSQITPASLTAENFISI
jgi:Ca2+-binding RTX toxin-like protein